MWTPTWLTKQDTEREGIGSRQKIGDTEVREEWCVGPTWLTKQDTKEQNRKVSPRCEITKMLFTFVSSNTLRIH